MLRYGRYILTEGSTSFNCPVKEALAGSLILQHFSKICRADSRFIKI